MREELTEKVQRARRRRRLLGGVVAAEDARDEEVREQLAQEAPLPPPGHARREEVRRREERLAARVQELASKLEGGESVGNLAEALGIEREIVQKFDADGVIRVSNARPDYVYAWISYDYPSHAKGAAVRRMLTRRGWEVVNEWSCTPECKRGRTATCGHNMPEAPDLRQPDGTRKVGDTILMRCPKNIFVLDAAIALAKRRLRERGKTATLGAMPFRKHEDPADPVVKEVYRRLGRSSAGQEEVLPEAGGGGNVG